MTGTIANNTSSGCTDPEVTLKFYDHNQALVQQFSFGAGELAAGQHRNWTTHMVGLLLVDDPVQPSVVGYVATAVCADRH